MAAIDTIARHVGKSESELRARLAASPRLSVVSSFSNLSVAETAISKALRANAVTINTWARSASGTMKLELDFHVVGQGVSRARRAVTTLRGVHIVLRRQEFNGMPYYILTVFPI